MVNAIAHIDIKPPRLSEESFVAGGAAAVAVAGRLLLGIRLGFHNHAPQEIAIGLAFHQQAADQLGGNLLGGAGEEGLGEALGGRGWLWEWLCVEMLRAANRSGAVGDNGFIHPSTPSGDVRRATRSPACQAQR